jgi:DNA-binding MurR/RpiR family transcriptional regulator
LRKPKRVSVERIPPRDFAELGKRLHACRSGASASVAVVATYAVEHPYDIAFGTSTVIAGHCGVSTPTVVRLAQTLGFDGFREMREFFRRPLRS